MTSAARTIVDLAAVLSPRRPQHIIETQVRNDNPTLEELLACFESVARRGVNGVAMLRRLLGNLFHHDPIPLSALEKPVAELLRANQITRFEPQIRAPWYDGRRGTVDFTHPQLGIVLEAVGRRWHQREQDMTVDRRRDCTAAAHGLVTVRVTWAEVTDRPSAIAQDLRAVIAARRSAADAA